MPTRGLPGQGDLRGPQGPGRCPGGPGWSRGASLGTRAPQKQQQPLKTAPLCRVTDQIAAKGGHTRSSVHSGDTCWAHTWGSECEDRHPASRVSGLLCESGGRHAQTLGKGPSPGPGLESHPNTSSDTARASQLREQLRTSRDRVTGWREQGVLPGGGDIQPHVRSQALSPVPGWGLGASDSGHQPRSAALPQEPA